MSQEHFGSANHLQAKLEQAQALHQRGVLSEAEKIYEEILRQQPDHADALHLLGIIALQTRRAERSVQLFRKAIEQKPDFAEAHSNRGNALYALRRYEEALASYDRAIRLKPDYAEAYSSRGIVLCNLRQNEDALRSSDTAIALNPGWADAHNNRGYVLRNLHRYEEALVSYDKAIALNPNHAEAYNNRGNMLQELRRYEEALVSHEKIIALRPDYAEGQWNKSLCLLKLGHLEQGWQLYEWRKKCAIPIAHRSYPQPLWLGQEDIAGKSLFLYWEQGFGDTLQFCRYATLVRRLGARVVMSVQDPLLRLLKQMEPDIAIIGENEEPSAFDYHCPLMSLPLAMDTRLETIPSEPSYLAADEKLRAEWAMRLPSKSKPRIGLVWSGNPALRSDRDRSMKLAEFLPILHDDVEWICLQKDINDEDRALLRQYGRVAFVGDAFKDFSDTAALVASMDLVITVDTSVAHLAGAMGKPVWIMLAYNVDWRWLTDRNDSPWYPSARLFRQREIGNWDDVVDAVRHELSGVVHGGDRAGASVSPVDAASKARELPAPQQRVGNTNHLQSRLEQALALHQRGSLSEAEKIYEEILRQQPDHADALHFLGVVALQMHRTARGVTLIERAITLKPDFAEAQNNLGMGLFELNRFAEAVASFDRAIVLTPDYALAHNNRGNALQELRRYEEALVSYDKAIELNPDYAEGHWNKSLCLLKLGHLEQGWRLYEWRKKCKKPIANRPYPQPLWSGQEEIAGKSLFIHWEQGFGDTLQFCRYAKLVRALGAQVTMAVQAPLRRLLEQMEPEIAIIGENEEPDAFDYHCPLMSLPLAMGTTRETVPSELPYLAADKRLEAQWSRRLQSTGKPRIGLAWRGNPAKNNDRDRSISLANLLPMLHDDAEWACLQKELNHEDAALLRRSHRVTFVGDALKDFNETAALVASMDLVITVDTSVAHLAGAMGKPVWILLAYNADWRWLSNGNDSPWYPSARLFRQREIGNWEDVIDEVQRELSSVTDGGDRAAKPALPVDTASRIYVRSGNGVLVEVSVADPYRVKQASSSDG